MENIKPEVIDTNMKNNHQAKLLQRDELEQVKSLLDRANYRMKAANSLAEQSEQLSERVLELLLETFSRGQLFREKTGHEYLDRMEIEEIQFCIVSIIYCLINGNSQQIEYNLISRLQQKTHAFLFSADGLIAAFNCIRENHGLTDEAKDAANEYIESAIAALSQLAQTEVATSELKIPEKSEILTLEEIKEKYPQQWVLIAYTEEDEYLNVIRGEVLAYSPDCDEIYDYLPNLNGKAVAIEYTGPIPETEEILTLAEIQQQYPHQWVLIVEPELDKYLNVIRGKVLAHSPDRDEAYSQFPLAKGKPVAIEYTGPISDDLAVMF